MIYKTITEFPNYVISENGNIYKNFNTEKQLKLKPKSDKDGYLNLGLRNESGRFFRRVHRLVAFEFCYNNNPNTNNIVNHIDGDVKNNHYSNLEWCDVSYNTRYSFRVLGRLPNITTNLHCKLYHNDIFVKNFSSIKDASIYAHQNYNTSIHTLVKYYKSKNVEIIIVEKCND